MMHRHTLAAGSLCVGIAAAFVQPAIGADDKQTAAKGLQNATPTATLDVASEQTRLIMGGTKGKGVLHFNGKDYPFTFKSASAGLGAKVVKNMSATGKVYSLNRIEDFAGQYTSVAKSAMAGSTAMTASYKNDKGVSIELRGTVEGVGLGLGGGIATVELIKQ